jgi:hypothetical protein
MHSVDCSCCCCCCCCCCSLLLLQLLLLLLLLLLPAALAAAITAAAVTAVTAAAAAAAVAVCCCCYMLHHKPSRYWRLSGGTSSAGNEAGSASPALTASHRCIATVNSARSKLPSWSGVLIAVVTACSCVSVSSYGHTQETAQHTASNCDTMTGKVALTRTAVQYCLLSRTLLSCTVVYARTLSHTTVIPQLC